MSVNACLLDHQQIFYYLQYNVYILVSAHSYDQKLTYEEVDE
jgi:hypothetical protein